MPNASFPGAVFDAAGASLTPGRGNLDQATLNAAPLQSMFVGGTPPATDGQRRVMNAGRMWFVEPGARFTDIPAAEVETVLAMLRGGAGLLILATNSATDMEIKRGLADLTRPRGVLERVIGGRTNP